MGSLEKEKIKLENSKEKIRIKEKLLKEKERMSNRATINSLGHLFVKTKLSHLDSEILLGALLEIAEKSNDEEALIAWRQKSQHHQKARAGVDEPRVTISFKEQPKLTQEIKTKLKEMKFKWNEFRGEYYGLGNREVLQKLLENYACNIENIETM